MDKCGGSMKGSDKRQAIKDYLEGTSDEELEFYFADGFDDAIIGYDSQTKKIIYSYSQMIQVMVKRDHNTIEEAVEYIDYNFFGFNENKVVICMDELIV